MMDFIVTKVPGGCIMGTDELDFHNAITDSDSLIGPLTIPEYYKGMKVLRIGQHAFSRCYRLTHVFIKAQIESIGYSAFVYCNNLVSINIPSSVKEIKRSAIGLGEPDNANYSTEFDFLFLYIEANSQLKTLEFNSICCKKNITVYYCGTHDVSGPDTNDGIKAKYLQIYSPISVKFGHVMTTQSVVSCIPQTYPQFSCANPPYRLNIILRNTIYLFVTIYI